MDAHQDPLMHINDFQLHDFIDDTNVDQFINLLRGENEHSFCNFDSDHINGYLAGNQFPPFPANLFESNAALNAYDPSSTLSSFSCFDGEVKGGRGEEENDSSATTTTTTETTTSANAKQKSKSDRSKTLISERRRRGRMKEKLYALRSLVPNISKMDKASIVGDAVAYVQELQEKAKKLKAEVKGLEASMLASENDQRSAKIPTSQNYHIHYPICMKIMQMDMFQVEERGYYVKLVCNKGEGVAASLYRALESLAGFNVQNSNLATVSDRFLLTFTLNVKGCEPEINQQNLKLWVAGALLNQGFEFITTFHA